MRYPSRTAFVLAALERAPSHDHILDIGFLGEYDRPFLHESILEACPDSRVLGIDTNLRIATFANTATVEYRQLSVFDLDQATDLAGRFNAAVLCEVFEHLPHPYLALHTIARCLAADGVLIMTWPNPLGLGRFARYLLRKNVADPEFIDTWLGAPDHQVFPMPPSMIGYLRSLGLVTQEVAFLKGRFSRLPVLEKFASYVGLVASKPATGPADA